MTSWLARMRSTSASHARSGRTTSTVRCGSRRAWKPVTSGSTVRSTHHVGVPFGGYKQSGIGREESIEELLACTQIKNVNVTLRRNI